MALTAKNGTKEVSEMTVYGRRPSETTLRIFRNMLEDMKADPLNRKPAESMKHPPKSMVERSPEQNPSNRIQLWRVK